MDDKVSMNNVELISRKIAKLRDKIRYHDFLYYSKAKPVISDYDYDMLMRKLESYELDFPDLITSDSPTQRVSGQTLSGFKTVAHKTPMLSLSNCYTISELHDFDRRLRKLYSENVEYVCELKIDGVAMSLTYKDHVLIRGTTRGDGATGDDITANVKTIKAIPMKVPSIFPAEFEVRGEVFYPVKKFEEMNNRREANGLKRFMNPRNGAAGTLKMLDTSEVARRPLSFFAYDFSSEQNQLRTHIEVLELLERGLFNINQLRKVCNSIEQVEEYWQKWDGEHNSLPYETDGIVVKLNLLAGREVLGSTAKSPRWAIAFKYSPTNTVTKLNDIVWQVGRTGALTPVALLEPIHLMGTMVSRATLHNWDEIKRLDIRIGDRVELMKGGDIIPKVLGIVNENRPLSSESPEMPKTCPSCGTKIEIDDSEAILRCNNWNCKAQLTERIIHFASRKAMNIDGLGAKTIELLVNHELIKDAGDLYSLTKETLETLPRQAELSAENILRGIRNSADMSLDRVVFGLGIRHVGSGSARILTTKYNSFEAMASADVEELESIDDIGPTIASAVNDYFRKTTNLQVIAKLNLAGVGLVDTDDEKITQSLAGVTFVITGTLENRSREKVAELIRSRGGKVTSTVSRKTTYVLSGTNPGSKFEKAQKIGVKIINETFFDQLMAKND